MTISLLWRGLLPHDQLMLIDIDQLMLAGSSELAEIRTETEEATAKQLADLADRGLVESTAGLWSLTQLARTAFGSCGLCLCTAPLALLTPADPRMYKRYIPATITALHICANCEGV